MIQVDGCVTFLALGESNAAIGRLRQDHRILFNCLQLSVKKLGSWQLADVMGNLQGGILTDNIYGLPSAFKDIQDALARPRVYRVCSLPCWSRHSRS